MPKKYLLYIHDHERFDELTSRGEKSGLINRLLAEHWNSPSKPIKKPADAVPVLEGQTELVCKHGAAPGFCKRPKCPNNRKPVTN